MNRPFHRAALPRRATAARLLTALLLCSAVAAGPARAAPAPVLASYPLFLAPPLAPNVLVLLDNSQSMDATMSGKVIDGDNPLSRGNIARSVLRGVIDANRSSFNWGLASFELSGPPYLWNTFAQFAGSATTMVYTNDCKLSPGSPDDLTGAADATGYSAAGPQTVVSAAGVTPLVYKNNCIQSPQPAAGFRYLTFEASGDDPAINDAYYSASSAPFLYGVGVLNTSTAPNTYQLFPSRDTSTTRWVAPSFVCPSGGSDCPTVVPFTPTDSGWLPSAADQPRMLFIRRGWGYGSYVTGAGRVVEPVVSSARATAAQAAAEEAHHANLMTALAAETINASGEIKNAAFFTPLAGSLQTAHDYFAGRLASAKSPITQSCQRNYVVLATDGNPTARLSGEPYTPAQSLNTRAADGSWVYGVAQQDLFDQISGNPAASSGRIEGLRGTTLTGSNLADPALAGRPFDVQTYVIGLGDTLANPGSIATLNQMALLGGGSTRAFTGSTAAAVQSAFQTIVGNIQKKQGGASSVTLNGATLEAGSMLYQATFDSSNWSGDLKAFQVSAAGVTATQPLWSAATRLARQDWNRGRTLLTTRLNDAGAQTGIAFRWPQNPAAPQPDELGPAQIAALNSSPDGANDNLGALRLQYLRGDRSQECDGCTPAFRNRGGALGPTGAAGVPIGPPLGDLVDSAPVLVGAPAAGYYDDLEAGAYSAFATAQRNRKKVVYIGGNDGLLHAFSADPADGGTELMGYVPSPLFGALNQLTAPNYNHRFFADGTPSVGDVFYGGSWKTLLVSGMRAGAKGVFALDVTRPESFSEAGAANIVRWEFLNAQDADMGYLFSQPVIVKTNNGRWSVIVANGYNARGAGVSRSTGHAVLFVLDAETGAVVKKLDTGAGSTASPNGLSGPAVIDANDDGIADAVYAGDLNGNLWKFDLSASAPSGWVVANGGLALFNTDEANPTAGTRPITSRPDVTLFPRGGYIVTFGSGSYLSSADATAVGEQSLYGIWDDSTRRSGTLTQDALVLQAVLATATGADGVPYRLTSHAVGTPADQMVLGDTPSTSLADYYGSKRGWRLTLPTRGERAVTDVHIRDGRAAFTTLIPNDADPCAYGGSGWLMEIDAVTGNRDDRGTFDTDRSGSIDAGDRLPFSTGGVSTASGRYVAGGIPATPGSVTSSSQPAPNTPPGRPSCVRVLYVAKSDGSTETVRVSCDATPFGRALWREVR